MHQHTDRGDNNKKEHTSIESTSAHELNRRNTERHKKKKKKQTGNNIMCAYSQDEQWVHSTKNKWYMQILNINYLLQCHAPQKMSTFATFNTFQLNFNSIITALRYFPFPYSHSFAAWTNSMSSIQFRLHVSLNHYKTLLAIFSPFFFLRRVFGSRSEFYVC